MAIDFRTYNDPGVYIEAITPPVVFTAAIEPTILAIVGDAPEARTDSESTTLSGDGGFDDTASSLTTLGIDPETVNTIDRLLGTQYVSARLATLDSAVSTVATAWTVSSYSDALLPPVTFTARIEEEEIAVSVATLGSAQAWTVARAQNGSVAAAHGAGQVLNITDIYTAQPLLGVGSFSSPVNAASTSVLITEDPGVQLITLTGFSGTDSFKLTYAAVETAVITRGTNYTQAGIKTALENHASITTVEVYTVLGRDSTLTDAGFIVQFVDPDPPSDTLLTVTSTSGVTGLASMGVRDDTYLDVEGERLLVTNVTGSAPQTVTVTRGVAGTTARQHGAIALYQHLGADYTERIGSGEDETTNNDDDTLALAILDPTRISTGTYVSLTFSATDAVQFSAGLFDDLDTVRDKYGDPLDSNGAINSALTLAAQLAFANGATQLVLVATDSSDGDPIQDGIAKLEFEQGVNSLCVLSGVSADLSYAQGHVNQMAEQGLLRRVFLGLDGVSATVTATNFVSAAQAFNDERVSLVAPGAFRLDNGTTTPLVIPGYFAAAAVAGIQAGLTPQEPLTRKQVYGFVGINNQDTSSNIFTMQSKGVLVVFEDRTGRLIIKHGLTTDMSTVYTREISVVAARDRLKDFIEETLDGGELIGSAQTPETPNLVMAAVNSALEESVLQGLIFDYNDVKFRFPTTNPTLIEIRFSYKPTLPLNYIHVQFNIDTNTGTVEFQSINQNPV